MNTYKITTDDTLRETARHGSGFYPFAYYLENIWQFDFHCVDWHWHHELEFGYIAKGSVLCLVGNDKIELHEGSGFFINSGILHRYEAKGSTSFPNIVFSPNLLAAENSLIYEKYIYPVIKSDVPYQIFAPRTDWQEEILQMLVKVFSLQESGEKNELRTQQLLLQIWELLYEHLDMSPEVSGVRHLSHQQARLQTMMQYIRDHYAQTITLDEIAASASVSKSGALHIFQSCIHVPPVAYLIQYRLAQAAEQLGTTEKSVSAIAEETGFASAGYFCRKFRQFYGMTPNAYRRKRG